MHFNRDTVGNFVHIRPRSTINYTRKRYTLTDVEGNTVCDQRNNLKIVQPGADTLLQLDIDPTSITSNKLTLR